MKVILTLFLSLSLFGCESAAQAEHMPERRVSCKETGEIRIQQQKIYQKLSHIQHDIENPSIK
jgi:hypothetical protein